MATISEGIDYARGVLAGEIVAGELVKLACERFFHDIEHGPERDVYFSEDRAQHVLDFFQFVPHVKGHLAGKPIELMPWHVFILINLFGFVRPLIDEMTGEIVTDEDGEITYVRRFRTAYDEVARKNAKSTVSSGIGLYMTGADGEGGAEVYSAATTRDQARIVFDDAKNMIKKAPKTLGRLFGHVKLNIFQERSASKFEPLSSDANNLDGLNIHCGIVDELHAHRTRDVWDVLETATGARLQSLLFAITTAGFNREGICYELRDYAVKVLQNWKNPDPLALKDDSFFALIYTLDADDDPWDETNWPKANPGLGVCKRWDDMRRLAKKAKQQPAARPNFFTKHLNIWVNAATSWMDVNKWNNCQSLASPDERQGWPTYVGVDLAAKIDIAAAVKVQQSPGGDAHISSRFWIPEGRLETCPEHIKDLYVKWEAAGKLTFTDGDVIDHQLIKAELVEWLADDNLKEVGYDPWQATQFALALAADGVPTVEVAQSVRNMSEAMKEAQALTYSGRLYHDNNPVMNWMISNVVVTEDKNENIFPNKSTKENKIDGPVAMFTGLSRLIVNGGEEPSVLDNLKPDDLIVA